MNRFVVAPSARDDLDGIWDYIGIENQNPAAADRVIDKFLRRSSYLQARR